MKKNFLQVNDFLTMTTGKSFWKNFLSSRDGAEKSRETRRGWESFKNPTPLRKDAGPFSGIQSNALTPLVHFVTYTTKRTRDVQVSALRWRPERGPASLRSRVGFLRLSHPNLLSVPFSGPSLFKMNFLQKPFPLVSVPLGVGGGGVLNQLSKNNSLHLRIRYHTADECFYHQQRDSICYSPPNHTADKCIIASNERVSCWSGDKHFGAGEECVSHWRQIRWKRTFEFQPHTHTASYQRLPNRTYVKMITSHNYSPPRQGTIALLRSKRYLDLQRHLPWC